MKTLEISDTRYNTLRGLWERLRKSAYGPLSFSALINLVIDEGIAAVRRRFGV